MIRKNVTGTFDNFAEWLAEYCDRWASRCLSVCPHPYLSNHMSELQQIFWRCLWPSPGPLTCYHTLITSGFVDDVRFFLQWTLRRRDATTAASAAWYLSRPVLDVRRRAQILGVLVPFWCCPLASHFIDESLVHGVLGGVCAAQLPCCFETRRTTGRPAGIVTMLTTTRSVTSTSCLCVCVAYTFSVC